MTSKPYPVDFNLLSLCAVMPSFDRETLKALGFYDESNLDQLLVSNIVLPATDEAEGYCLREDVRDTIIQKLRAEQPSGEQELLSRVFEYFLQRREQAEHIQSRERFEKSCLYYLDKLFFLLAPQFAWNTITQYITLVQRVELLQNQSVYQISFYEGHIALRSQNYGRAETIFNTLLKKIDLDSNIKIRVLNGTALLHMERTNYDLALNYYQTAYKIAHKINDLFYQGATLINMGMIYNELHQYELAIDFTDKSLCIFRKIGDIYREAQAIYELGNSSLLLGRWDVAKQYLDQGIKLYHYLDLTSHLVSSYGCQGLLYHLCGDEGESEASYTQALTILQSDQSNLKVANEILWYLAFLYHTQNRWEEAINAYDRALALARELQRPHYISLILYQRGNLFKRLGRVEETEEAYRQAIETIETLRGATEGEEIKIGLLGTTQQIYESMVLLCLEQGRFDEAFAYVERARSRAFLDTLAKKDPEIYAALDEPIATLSDVQQQLPEDALLIEYFTTGVLPRGEHMINNLPKENERLREYLTLPPHIIIFAITRDRFEVHRLDRGALDANALRPKEHDPDPSRRLLSGRMRNHLYTQLLGPVEHLLRGRSLLYLVPHGPLHSVPFMALQSGQNSYLLDRSGPAVALAPSATVLLHSCLRRPKVQDGRFLALGYNDVEHGLCYAETEVQQIAHLMDGEAWNGPDPKSEALFAVGPQLRWLHIAGHAAYNPRAPLDSELFLGADDRLSARTIMNRLHLRAAGVTLSACMSGLGQVVAGDELLGMQRAWLYAGAPTIVCTLWETADLVALLIMERFYTDLRAGRPAAAALRDAQVAVRELTMADLVAIAQRWRTAGIALPDMLNDLATTGTDADHTCPFADPTHWAPFLLIGRPE